MKKLLILVLILGFGGFSGVASGQETKGKENERKGGFAVGGYDNTRQEKDKVVTKRSVELPAEEQQAEKAAEVEKVPTPGPTEAPTLPASEAKPQKEDKSNAYGKNKDGIEGKELNKPNSGDGKSKQTAKKVKSKSSRR